MPCRSPAHVRRNARAVPSRYAGYSEYAFVLWPKGHAVELPKPHPLTPAVKSGRSRCDGRCTQSHPRASHGSHRASRSMAFGIRLAQRTGTCQSRRTQSLRLVRRTRLSLARTVLRLGVRPVRKLAAESDIEKLDDETPLRASYFVLVVCVPCPPWLPTPHPRCRMLERCLPSPA